MSDAGSILDALIEDRLAIVGKTGSGKTYAAKTPVEKLIRDGARVCIVDPLGVWYGLRAGPDGAAAGGLPVIIFGGLHADVPITDQDGTRLARIVAESDIRCIVDVSELGSGRARRRFMLAFAETLFDINRDLLHLVLDEADLWAPQRPLPDQTVLQGLISEIVRRGRVLGFVPWLITQRPAVLDKDVLSQADTLIAMQLTSSQDRKAIGGWIEGQADRAEGKRILADLPRLSNGEGYIWAPSRSTLVRQRFPAITTFDSSKTPKRGEPNTLLKSLATVDADALRELLAAAPDEPSAKVSEGISYGLGFKDAANKLGAEMKALLSEEYHRGFGDGQISVADRYRATVTEFVDAVVELVRKSALDLVTQFTSADPIRVDDRQPLPTLASAPIEVRRPPVAARRTGAELRILAVLAQGNPSRLTMAQWAALSGMSRKGGTWGTYVSRLRVAGYLIEEGGFIAASAAGLKAAGHQPRLPSSPAEVRAMWKSALGGGVGRLVDILAEHPKGGLTRSELAEQASMTPSGGTFGTYLSRLRTNGLIWTDPRGTIRLVKELLDDR